MKDMARWNHFSIRVYENTLFTKLDVGDKFRMDKWKGKLRRQDIIHVKDGDTTYHEFKSKTKGKFLTPNVYVSHYSKKFVL